MTSRPAMNLDSRAIQELVNNATCTLDDVRERYGVCAMTVHGWRAKGMPAVVLQGASKARGRPSVRFVQAEVSQWVRRNMPDRAPVGGFRTRPVKSKRQG